MGLYDDYSREELIQKIETEVRLKKELLPLSIPDFKTFPLTAIHHP